MKALKTASVFSLVVLFSSAALAQDPVKVDPSHYKVVLENASVRVLKITYAPGAKSVMHQHPDSIVVPLVASKVRFGLPDGKTQDQELANESAMYTPAGTHNPTNVGTTAIDALLIEFKAAAPGKATLPANREGMTMSTLRMGTLSPAARRASSRPSGGRINTRALVSSR